MANETLLQVLEEEIASSLAYYQKAFKQPTKEKKGLVMLAVILTAPSSTQMLLLAEHCVEYYNFKFEFLESHYKKLDKEISESSLFSRSKQAPKIKKLRLLKEVLISKELL